MPEHDLETLFSTLVRRYGVVEPEALVKVLCPLHVRIRTLDTTIVKRARASHYGASFTVAIDDENREVMVPGRTGKFIPLAHLDGAPWREIAKGRICEVDEAAGVAYGEVHITSGSKANLAAAVADLTADDILEIDQYGAASKVLSALVESTLATDLKGQGFTVRRMPEDTAKHIGGYYNFDFLVQRAGAARKVEVKSLWGTNTRCARLIHNAGRSYEINSCKFSTQDIFAVSLFLRTGRLTDFAFARSVPNDVAPYGLPRATKARGYVNQTPPCEIGDGVWFGTIDDVWDLP